MYKYLIVISSACQMNSGTGRLIFDWITYSKVFFDFTILIDTHYLNNAAIVAEFSKTHSIKYILSDAFISDDACDTIPLDIPNVLQSEDWDFVECYSWASSATNTYVCKNLKQSTKLIYTPISQPLDTIPDKKFHESICKGIICSCSRADIIFLISEHELRHYSFLNEVLIKNVHTSSLGISDKFSYKLCCQDSVLLSIFDCREPRKRADLHFNAVEKALVNYDFRFEIGGASSSTDMIPYTIRDATSVLSYLTDDELIEKYRTSKAFILISDYEAFGYPIAEALCCGCPVIINLQEELIELYSSLPGVHFVNNNDISSVAKTICSVMSSENDRQLISECACKKFSLNNILQYKLDAIKKLYNKDVVNSSYFLNNNSENTNSFSQDGTDRIIFCFLKMFKVDFYDLKYLELGSAHPIGHNNTYLFYTLGAQGLLVEADPMYIESYRLYRNRDEFLNVAVIACTEDNSENVVFYRHYEPGHSTVVENLSLDQSMVKDIFSVKAISIHDICVKYYPFSKIDVLSIDVEGLDEDIIFHFPFHKFEPLVIVYEKGPVQHELIFTSKVTVYLESKGYVLVASTFINLVYIKRHILETIGFLQEQK